MRWWKWVGLAGIVGAAAVGAVAVQHHRARVWRDVPAAELRDRLHERLRASQVS
jgi:hypothetical protein